MLPISFFLSSVAAGTALVDPDRDVDREGLAPAAPAWRALAAMGQITFWSLLVYLVFRLGDMAIRGRLAGAFTGRLGALFAIEIVLGGLVPLVLLARAAFARPPGDRSSWARSSPPSGSS